ELVAPVAEAQVLDCPRQRRGGRRERHELAHDLQLLTGLAIAVDAIGLGFEDDLASRRRSTESITLTVHRRDSTSDMRVLIFHGYLLRGTGSNVYNAR